MGKGWGMNMMIKEALVVCGGRGVWGGGLESGGEGAVGMGRGGSSGGWGEKGELGERWGSQGEGRGRGRKESG